MKCNSGGIERSLRVLAGLVLITLAVTGTVGMWGWIGVIPLFTGIVGFCPAYTLFGMNTCNTSK
jgi:hypothetical protein